MHWRANYILSFFFFFNDTATTEIYTLSLHDALPISQSLEGAGIGADLDAAEMMHAGKEGRNPHGGGVVRERSQPEADRKSTRLNSSHSQISYAVFCLEKKKTQPQFPRY